MTRPGGPAAAPFGELRNRDGERLDFAWTPGAAGDARVVVIGHGVTSHHDRPWLVAVGEACARRGMAALRVSFAGNGKSEGRYEAATITKEVADLRAVIDALAGRRVAYVGHSMGAAVGVIAAAQDRRIAALVSLAGMIEVRRFVDAQFAGLVPGRDVMLGKPHCPLSQAFLDDADALGDVLGFARAVEQPWLAVHGTDDELVPFGEPLRVQQETNHDLVLIPFPGADHRFTGHEAAMAERVADWLDHVWP